MGKTPSKISALQTKGLGRSSFELTLPADQTLTQQNFTIDPGGNVLIKNRQLADALKRGIQTHVGNADIAAVKVGVVVDW